MVLWPIAVKPGDRDWDVARALMQVLTLDTRKLPPCKERKQDGYC